MKVKDLLRELEGVDPETPVLVSKDAEGNGFANLGAVHYAYTEDPTQWEVELTYPPDDDEEEDEDFPWNEDDYTEVIVLWP